MIQRNGFYRIDTLKSPPLYPRGTQSKAQSFLEAVVSTLVGLVVSMVAMHLICLAYGIEITTQNNFIITAWMTVLSVVRSYVMRRLFNRMKS